MRCTCSALPALIVKADKALPGEILDLCSAKDSICSPDPIASCSACFWFEVKKGPAVTETSVRILVDENTLRPTTCNVGPYWATKAKKMFNQSWASKKVNQ